ncbi:MAG: phenylalanine 4-monooxygenase [Deltaproteobacteria bacterium]|nr:phenylalanine 4-monooxygenase [Deltaproteobacteria bacterium]
MSATMRAFDATEHETWRRLYERLEHCRKAQAHPMFAAGLARLGIAGDGIPTLDDVNARLDALTGWRGVPVSGLEDGRSFFALLAERRFPIGAFIRDARDLSYTPAPDIFHDMYGHLPLFADPAYADFCHRFGVVASRHADDAVKLRRFERLFWFGVEFPLVEVPHGELRELRIMGGGILSSFGESSYALSGEPEVRRFDLLEIRDREYRIDEMQRVLYAVSHPETLYGCLEVFERLATA